MVNCLSRRKKGGSVLDRIKEGTQGWKNLGNKSIENIKYAAEKAKQEQQVAIDSYKRQKSINNYTSFMGGKKTKKKKYRKRKKSRRRRKSFRRKSRRKTRKSNRRR